MSSPELSNGSTWLDAYREALAFEEKIGIIVPTFFALIVFVGLTGNVLVILVVAINPTMRNSTNMLIVNLALADLLFLLLCVPFTATDYATSVWVFADFWCSILQYLQNVSAYASVWTLVLMAVDRFLAVVFPVQSMTLK
ncbi:unnamed protein product [Soboliphyme baturini]|uniref:G_PROTEIN_RECEP_F1_2 domain-containing protein n=1 Tax=Soboliphyme baturini TaxID=241478 RepID=A0A183IP39_9BILA|nr:unnamed protein product [Soboliphyme baturini]